MIAKPLVIDLFCGRFGWSRGFLAEGYRAVGFDLIHETHHGPVPEGCELVLQNVLDLHGSQFRNAAAIVASPPCTEYSYMAMPWSRGKWIAAALRGKLPFPLGYEGSRTLGELTALFDCCFRLQREASEAAGRYIPLLVENVKGAQPWVGRARAHFGSFYLWGDIESVGGRIVGKVPKFGESLRVSRMKKGRSNFHFFEETGLPSPSFHGADHEGSVQRHASIKNQGGSWFDVANNTESGTGQNPVNGAKVPGISWSGYGEPGYKAQGLNVTAAKRFRDEQGVKQNGSGPAWFDTGVAKHSSKSDSRKAASAAIAEIPLDLSRYIARMLKSDNVGHLEQLRNKMLSCDQ